MLYAMVWIVFGRGRSKWEREGKKGKRVGDDLNFLLFFFFLNGV